jgi:thiamine biosynthesis lipoprotein
MGTRVAVTVLHASRDRADEAIGRAFQEMDRLIGLLNRYDPSSAVGVLNAAGHLAGAPPELTHVVGRSLDYHRLTCGAFDVTVRPLVDLFRDRALVGGPSGDEVREALALVGAGALQLERRAVRFRRAGMGVTLDGIAKGYIVDRMGAELERRGVKRYLVEAGGDIRSRGTKEGNRPWTVAVEDPEKGGAFPDVIHLQDGAVATSGSYEICYDRDGLLHHIVNGRTGSSPHEAVSVSVVAPSALAADALATGVFVMGPQAGLSFIESLSRCECLIIDRRGAQLRSRGWKSAAPTLQAKAEA